MIVKSKQHDSGLKAKEMRKMFVRYTGGTISD